MSEEFAGFKLGEAMSAPGYVAVPLDEYKRFLEFQFKGPTIEVPVEEYDRLKEENAAIRRENEYLNSLANEVRNEREFMLCIEKIIKREVEKIEFAVIACIRNMQKGSENVVSDSVTMRTPEEERTAARPRRYEVEAERGK